MQKEPLYLFNAPEDPRENTSDTKKLDNLNAIFNRPLTGEDIAYKVMKAQQQGANPNLTLEEFRMYEPWKAKQEFDFWGAAGSAFVQLGEDAVKGARQLTPAPEFLGGVGVGEGLLNMTTRLPSTLVEAFGRGTRNLGHMIGSAFNHPASPFQRVLMPSKDEAQRFADFNETADFDAKSARIAMGKENAWLPDPPNTSKMLGEDASKLDPNYLFGVNQEIAEAGSYVLDPTVLLTFGGSIPEVAAAKAFAKAGLKGAFSKIGSKIISAGMKEGISSTASAFKNSFGILEKAKVVGRSVMENTGKAMKVAGGAIDRQYVKAYDWATRLGNDYLDLNLHTTGAGAIKTTGVAGAEGGVGGNLLFAAGAGATVAQVPYASLLIPIWGAAKAAKIGGAFFEGLGKELVAGEGALGRLAQQANATGRLAKVAGKWSPLADYVTELAKTTAKAGAWGTTLGYISQGEEGAAGGLGTGGAIGVGGYHLGLAHNMFFGNSKEQMSVRLASHLDQLKEKGFTQNADNISAYLEKVRIEKGDDTYYRNVGAFIRLVDNPDVTTSFFGKADFIRMSEDPAIDPQFRKELKDIIDKPNSWNGLFYPRRGLASGEPTGKPYFLVPMEGQNKTHVVINVDAFTTKDGIKSVASTGIQGEFYHTMMDIYGQVHDKPKAINEMTDVVTRQLNLSAGNPEGRTAMAKYFREALDNLKHANIEGPLKQEGAYKKPITPKEGNITPRAKNLLKIAQQHAPDGFTVKHSTESKGKAYNSIQEGKVKRPTYRWEHSNGTIYENADGTYATEVGKNEATQHKNLAEAFADFRKQEAPKQGEAPPNVKGERTSTAPEAEKLDPRLDTTRITEAEKLENTHQAIDKFEKDGTISPYMHVLIEEMGETAFLATEANAPFDWVFLHGDLGFARNMIAEIKHRMSNIYDRAGRQHGFVPDYTKPFAEWGKDKDGKPISDPYMRKIFAKFLQTHKDYSNKFKGWQVDIDKMPLTQLKQFIAENSLEEEFHDNEFGVPVRKSEEAINQQNHVKYQAAVGGLIELEKAGIDSGFEYYAIDEKSVPEAGSLDEESGSGALKQAGWQQYRTTAEDIRDAQKKGTIPSKEEMEAQLKRRVFGKRGRPRTGEIDDLVATAKKGSIVFVGVPTMEAFKVLQKHLPKKDMQHLAQLAPLILDGGTTKNNIVRVKYAGFQMSPEEGRVLKRPKDVWDAQEKNIVFHAMELRATLRNPKSGTYDYKKAHAAFMLRGVDVDVIQRRILWMWKNERGVKKRWANHTEFEKDVYRLIENYSMRDAMGGTNFFGGGDEGAAKKRLACAAIGAFPTKEMQGISDGGEMEYTVPEIDWHHYQLKGYGKGNAGRDIPWTNIRLDNIKQINDAEGMLRMPYAERAYYRTQALFQRGEGLTPRDGQDTPAVVKAIKFEGDNVEKAFEDADTNYSPSKTIKNLVDAQKKLKQSPLMQNLSAFTKGGVGHDATLDKPLIYWHGFGEASKLESADRGSVGIRFGTREEAIKRNFELGIIGNKATDALVPVVTNIKNPLSLPDMVNWTGHSVAKAILESQQGRVQENSIYSVLSPASIEALELRKQIGNLSSSDIKFLENYTTGQEAKGLTRLEVVGDRRIQTAKEITKEAEPINKFLEGKGYDGIVYKNESDLNGNSYIAFKSASIRDAVQNKSTYNSRDATVLRQQGWTIGATNPEQARALKANWDKSAKEGDIFKATSIKDNFLGDMPRETVVIRQTVEEAMVQGITREQFESQFVTGKPVAFVALHGFDNEKSFKESVVKGKPFNKSKRSNYAGMFWTGDMETSRAYGYRAENGKPAQARAILKMKNPLVLDFAGMNEFEQAEAKGLIDKFGDWADDGSVRPAWDLLNDQIPEAVRNGHDGIIALNIDEAGGNTAQFVIPHEFTENSIAIIDSSLDTQPVGRGLGINLLGKELPMRQTNGAGQTPEEWKPTFYSAVERFVQEKVTDKTPVEQLLAMMDPAKGTGLAKAELTWLDVAGWVDREKAAGKKKVDKEALLRYISENKVEIQELRPEDTKSGMSQYTPEQQQQLMANPQIQEILSSNYSGYTAPEKGFDAQPQENYRVFIIRGKKGEVYGFTGHWSDPQNIIAHLRTIDSYLTKGDEIIPSDLKGKGDRSSYISGQHVENSGFVDKYQGTYITSTLRRLQHIVTEISETGTFKIGGFDKTELLTDELAFKKFKKIPAENIANETLKVIKEMREEAIKDYQNGLIRSQYNNANPLVMYDIGQRLTDFLYYLQYAQLNTPDSGGLIVSHPYKTIIENNLHNGNSYVGQITKESLNEKLTTASDEVITSLFTEIYSKIQEDTKSPEGSEYQGRYRLLNIQEVQSDTAQAISNTRRETRTEAEEAEHAELSKRSFNELAKEGTEERYNELQEKSDYVPILTKKEADKLGVNKINLSEEQIRQKETAYDLTRILTGVADLPADSNTVQQHSDELWHDAVYGTSVSLSRNGNDAGFADVREKILLRLGSNLNLTNRNGDSAAYRIKAFLIDYAFADIKHSSEFKNLFDGVEPITSYDFGKINEWLENIANSAIEYFNKDADNSYKRELIYEICETLNSVEDYRNSFKNSGLFNVLSEDGIPETKKVVDEFLTTLANENAFKIFAKHYALKSIFGNVNYEIKEAINIKTKKNYIEIPSHPFEKTDHWTRLAIRKWLRVALEEGYDGGMLIPEDLPRKIVGGEEGGNEYYYGKVLPRIINEELKKFGLQLRYSKSEQTRRSAPAVPWEQRRAEYWASHNTTPERVEPIKNVSPSSIDVWLKMAEDENLNGPAGFGKSVMDIFVSLFKDKNITFEEAKNAFEYVRKRRSGKIMFSEYEKYISLQEPQVDLTENPASERSLMFLWHEAKKPEIIKGIKEGMPMYQKGEGEAKPAGEPETVGDITGQPVKKKRVRPTIGPLESGTPMPTMPTAGIFGKDIGGEQIQGESFEHKVMRDGTGEHRGYKVVKDKQNGGFKIFDPAGKLVKIPIVYKDKMSGVQTVKYENSAALPNEAMDFIDHTLGGVADTQKDEPIIQKPISPAKVDVRSGKPLNPEPARSEPANNEAEVVKSNVDAQGNSKYYIYNIGKDKNGKYFATDNSGQPISLFVESPTQAGPRVVSGNSTKDFNSLISQLDKKFDKTRFARLAPVPHKIVEPSNKPIMAESAKPVTQTPAPAPIAKPAKTANVNTLPSAIQKTMAEKPVTPKSETVKPVKTQKQPKVIAPKQEAQPLEVISDEQYLIKQAKSLGKGFLEMLRDPELKDYIINSLNADDNLTLKGTTENANSFDSRYSAVREGKKIIVYQNDYQSPITGVKYNKKPVAYVNNMQQAQMLIRRIEVERMMVMKANGMKSENPLAVMAGQNPAFQSIADAIEIRNNAFMQMLLDMRDKGITPVMIDPRTLEPILTILPSEPYINPAPFLRREFKNRVRGLIAENATITEPMGLSIIDNASRFDMFQMAEIKGLDYNTKMRATRFRNTLGYEILKFNESTFKVFNPYKSSIAVMSNLEDSIDEIIKDIHKNGLGQK